MKIVVLSAKFSVEGLAGSDVFQHGLFDSLALAGHSVRVLTVDSDHFIPEEAFGLRWVPRDNRKLDPPTRYSLTRYPISFNIPQFITRIISRLILTRWRFEDSRFGAMEQGSARLPNFWQAISSARPRWYSWISAFGLGPHSINLFRAFLVEARDSDVVIATYLPFGTILLARSLAHFLKKKFFLVPLFHSADRYHYFENLISAIRNSTGVIALTAAGGRIFQNVFGQNNVCIAGMGVNEVHLETLSGLPSTRLQDLRDRFKVLLLFVGRKEPSKGYRTVIEALMAIHKREFHLLIVGKDIDGAHVDPTFCTHWSDVGPEELRWAYSMCDVFVFPSLHESFGIVILEAWAAAKPVIGNRLCPAVASVIRHKIDGLLCATFEEWVDSIGFIASNPRYAKRIGSEGQARVKNEFRWSSVANRVGNFLGEGTS
jgi:glycosyltransferase involved in cell wall biosynthesis